LEGTVEKIKILVTGYEAILTVNYKKIGRINCTVKLSSEYDPLLLYQSVDAYVEDRSSIIKIGSEINSSLKVEFGNNLRVINDNQLGFTQDIEESPHVICVGRVVTVLESHILTCNISDGLENITVDFEESFTNISLGDVISFSGEFSIIFDW
jgi:hypothetical protein